MVTLRCACKFPVAVFGPKRLRQENLSHLPNFSFRGLPNFSRVRGAPSTPAAHSVQPCAGPFLSLHLSSSNLSIRHNLLPSHVFAFMLSCQVASLHSHRIPLCLRNKMFRAISSRVSRFHAHESLLAPRSAFPHSQTPPPPNRQLSRITFHKRCLTIPISACPAQWSPSSQRKSLARSPDSFPLLSGLRGLRCDWQACFVSAKMHARSFRFFVFHTVF